MSPSSMSIICMKAFAGASASTGVCTISRSTTAEIRHPLIRSLMPSSPEAFPLEYFVDVATHTAKKKKSTTYTVSVVLDSLRYVRDKKSSRAAALFASAPPPLKAALETVDRSGSLAVFTTTSLSEAHSFASAARDGIAQLLLDDSREVFEHHHDWGAFTDIVCGLCALVAAYAAVFLTHVQTLTLHAVDDAATLERAALLCVKFTARFPLAAIARVRRGEFVSKKKVKFAVALDLHPRLCNGQFRHLTSNEADGTVTIVFGERRSESGFNLDFRAFAWECMDWLESVRREKALAQMAAARDSLTGAEAADSAPKACLTCSSHDVSAIFLPCRHLVMCQTCAAKHAVCPACGASVTTVMNVFT